MTTSQPKAPRRRVGMWLARVTLALLTLAGAWLALVPPGRAAVRGVALLASVLGASGATSTTDRPDVLHTSSTLQVSNGTEYLDLFQPRGAPPLIPGARPGVILIPGVGDGRGVAQLVNLEDSFAEVGVDVLTISPPGLLNYILTPNDKDDIVQAFQMLAHTAGVNAGAIGIIGISGGGSIGSLAAADPRIRDQVAYLTLFGSYFDAAQLVREIGQRGQQIDGQLQPWMPLELPLQVLANTVAPYLTGGTLLTVAFGSNYTPQPPAVVAALDAPAQAAYHLLAGDEPEQVAANEALLPAGIQTLFTQVSPKSILSQIRAPIYILHDRHDQYVPYAQSRACAAALAASGQPHTYVEFDIFQHVEVRGDLPLGTLLGDGTHLFGILVALLSYGA
jgi:pimeloyl-ACP methyl ester carboxylesterase